MKFKSFISKITLLLVAIFMSATFFSSSVKAYYDEAENKLVSFSANRKTGVISINIQYQIGIKDVHVYICGTEYNINTCQSNNEIGEVKVLNDGEWIINRDIDKPTNFVYDFDKNNKVQNLDGTDFNFYVTAQFCEVADANSTTCKSSHSERYKFFTPFNIDKGFTTDAKLNTTLNSVLGIVNTVGIPVLWVIMGILLLVRGIILGIDIVKSSDDPEIRKKKINGLIWLFIGVGVGYAVTILATYVMGMFGYGGIFS